MSSVIKGEPQPTAVVKLLLDRIKEAGTQAEYIRERLELSEEAARADRTRVASLEAEIGELLDAIARLDGPAGETRPDIGAATGPAELLPVGTYFRLKWASGRLGAWHRARKPEQYGFGVDRVWGQYCACSVGVTRDSYRENVTVVTASARPTDHLCRGIRKKNAPPQRMRAG